MIKSNVVHPMRRESSLDRSNKVASLRVDSVYVRESPLRPLDEEKVKLIATSMARLGLMTPITVRYHEERPDYLPPDDEESSTDAFELLAGRHRLAAAKSLGWDWIDVDEIKCSDIEAKLWEIAENLHRAELTALERAEQIALWIKMTDGISVQVAPKSVGRPESGISAAARGLGIEETDAKRAVKVSKLSNEAKAAAVEHGLDDNRSALLEAAKEKDPKDQVKKIAQLAKAKAKPQYTPKEEANRERITFIMRIEEAQKFAFYDGKPDAELVRWAKETAAAWCALVDRMERDLASRRTARENA